VEADSGERETTTNIESKAPLNSGVGGMMATYRVVITGVTAANIKSLEKKIKAALGEEFSADVRRQDPSRSRADRLDEAAGMVEDAAMIVEELKDELQEWLDGLPENLQSGSKADELNDAISELESIYDSLGSVDTGSVSFPGMY
jgi:hypothetical protein